MNAIALTPSTLRLPVRKRLARGALAALMVTVGALAACGGGDTAVAPTQALPTEAPAPVPASPSPVLAVTPLPELLTLTVPPYAEPGTAVTLSSNQGAGQGGLSYTWDFGNGTSAATARVAPMTYAAGRYVVRLTVSNEAGAARVATSQLLVGPQEAVNVGLGCSKPDGRGWCSSQASVNDLYFRAPLTGWAADARGAVLRTTDGGLTWRTRSTGTTWALSTVRFADDNRGWVLGATEETVSQTCPPVVVIRCSTTTVKLKPRILKTVDGGVTWVEQDIKLEPGQLANALTVIDANRAIIHSRPESRVTADGGTTWTAAPYSPTVVLPSGRVWTITTSGTLLVSDDLGLTAKWDFTLGGKVDAVHFSDDRVGTAHVRPTGAPGHLVYRTANGGDTWVPTPPEGLPDIAPADYYDASVVTSDANVTWLTLGERTASIFGYGRLDRAYRSTDGGKRWSLVPLPAGQNAWGLRPTSANQAWLGRYLTRDGGLTWTAIGKDDPVRQPVASAAGLLVGVSDPTLSGIRWQRTADDGVTWAPVFNTPLRTSGAHDIATAYHFFDASRWMATAGENLYETRDGGRTWALNLAHVGMVGDYYGNQGVSRLQFVSPTNGWLLIGSLMRHTADGGVTWTEEGSPPLTGPFAMKADFDFRTDRQGVAVTTVGEFSLGGSPAPGAVGLPRTEGPGFGLVTSLRFTPASVRWASDSVAVTVGSGGTTARSTDGGKTWTEQATPVTKTLLRLTFVDSSNGWAVGEGGTVLRTADAGLTWKTVAVPSTVKLTDVVFPDALNGYIVGDAGTVLATHDAGTTWTPQTTGTVHDIAAIYSPGPGVVRMLTREGYVYTSSTGGH